MKEQERLQVQAKLLPVVQRLDKVAAQDPSFASLAIDSLTNTVTVYRVGGRTGQTAAYLSRQCQG